jgi:hypothetical protein
VLEVLLTAQLLAIASTLARELELSYRCPHIEKRRSAEQRLPGPLRRFTMP